MLMDKSWRHSYLSASETQRKLHRQTDIFNLYIVLLAALFAFALIPAGSTYFSWVQAIVFFLTLMGFFASFSLPFTLKAIQKQRLDKAIADRQAGN